MKCGGSGIVRRLVANLPKVLSGYRFKVEIITISDRRLFGRLLTAANKTGLILLSLLPTFFV